MLKKIGFAALTIFPVLVLGAFGQHQLLGAPPKEEPVAYVEIAGRRVAIWKPAGVAPPNGYPLILFSHGFTGCGTQSVFLTDALAGDGYLVLAPDHHDAACERTRKTCIPRPIRQLPQPRAIRIRLTIAAGLARPVK